MPSMNPDFEAIQRALREISHIHDGAIVKTLKGLLERQARMLTRMDEYEERQAALLKRPTETKD